MGGVIMYEAEVDPPLWVGAKWAPRYQNTGLDRMPHFVQHWDDKSVTFKVPTAGLSAYWGTVTCTILFTELHSRMRYINKNGVLR